MGCSSRPTCFPGDHFITQAYQTGLLESGLWDQTFAKFDNFYPYKYGYRPSKAKSVFGDKGK